jgi:CHASE3 domain sensor protein
MNANAADKRKAVRRTTIFLVAVALAFYLGFILMGLLRA